MIYNEMQPEKVYIPLTDRRKMMMEVMYKCQIPRKSEVGRGTTQSKRWNFLNAKQVSCSHACVCVYERETGEKIISHLTISLEEHKLTTMVVLGGEGGLPDCLFKIVVEFFSRVPCF